jgi:predicted enzyme related to lactoylglutathione lyase
VARVTGIGGVFFRAREPQALAAWYAEHLGIQLEEWGGARFRWSDELPAGTGATAWNIFPAATDYFGSGEQACMINYRVDDLDGLLAQLAASGAAVEPRREDYSYGRFAWITDPEGNRVELWQPLVLPESSATNS